MKELDIRVDDVLYWADQEWECKEVDEFSYLKFLMKRKKQGDDYWFTKFGQYDATLPPVLSFTPYSIETGGATFERPKEPLRPVDVSTLQKVRFRDSEYEAWGYGYLVSVLEKDEYPFLCLGSSMKSSHPWEICEPYEWTDEEVKP